MIVRATPLLAQFREGIYDAVVERVEAQNGQFGEYLRFHFMVPTKQGEAVTVNGLTSTIFNPRSKMYAWVTAITGKAYQTNEVLDTDTLHGKPCRVYLTIKELDGGGSINQVEKVLPREEVDNSIDNDDDTNPFD